MKNCLNGRSSPAEKIILRSMVCMKNLRVRQWALSDQGQGHGMTLTFSIDYLLHLPSQFITIISSCLNDFTNCGRCFNVNIMMLYISAMDHAKKLKFSSYVHLPFINKTFQNRYALVIV